jgi:diadenosine tetraphosphate (Ap4A) HIT family hydrolase
MAVNNFNLEVLSGFMSSDCIFCKIINGEIPSSKILETENVFAFMDISPLSVGHCLFVPKQHAATLHTTDDNTLSEILILMKKVAIAAGFENYNILQNNGKIAHQAVLHTHFHLIPKNSADDGLTIGWKPKEAQDIETIRDKIIDNLFL